jgi:hypothetical protein
MSLVESSISFFVAHHFQVGRLGGDWFQLCSSINCISQQTFAEEGLLTIDLGIILWYNFLQAGVGHFCCQERQTNV